MGLNKEKIKQKENNRKHPLFFSFFGIYHGYKFYPRISCELGKSNMCVKIAGESTNIEFAAKLYNRACELNNLTGCSRYASLLYKAGKLVESGKYFKMACDGDKNQSITDELSGVSCLILAGLMHKNDSQEAIEYVKRSCSLGNKKACEAQEKIQGEVNEAN